MDLKYLAVDYHFVPTYNMKLLAGRNFSSAYATDSTNFLINETAASTLGFKTPQEAVNKELVYGGTRGRVIGVLQDFYFESLHQHIPSMILLVLPNNLNAISIKLSSADLSNSLAFVEKTWKKFLPETPFSYTFLNERFEKVPFPNV